MLRLPADHTAAHKLLFFQYRQFKRHSDRSSGESAQQHSGHTHEHSTGYLNGHHQPRAGEDAPGSAPQDCAITPPPQQKHLDGLGSNSNVSLIGGGAFWFYAIFYSNVLHLGPSSADQRWPMTKWVVEVGPNYAQPVTLRLQDVQTKTLAWWTDGQTPPRAATQVLILNPLTDTQDVGSVPGIPDVPHGPSGSGWSEWGLFPVFFAAGCYSLEVSWSGGSWQSIMAVGS